MLSFLKGFLKDKGWGIFLFGVPERKMQIDMFFGRGGRTADVNRKKLWLREASGGLGVFSGIFIVFSGVTGVTPNRRKIAFSGPVSIYFSGSTSFYSLSNR